MEFYGILNTRKRAIIALVHSVAFFGIAMMGLQSAPKTGLFAPHGRDFTAANFAIFGVYLIVSTVLLVLTRYSRCLKERAYFALCAASASVGLLRALFGDPVPHLGPIARVLLLGTAVAIGLSILGYHTQPQPIPES